MNPESLTFIYAIFAIYIAWIWVDYFRLIDIYERENLKHFLLVFLLGGLSVYITFGIASITYEPLGIRENGNPWNDLFFSIFCIGAIEEFSKLVPLLLILVFNRKLLNEPIDYVAFISVSALGFSAAENVLYMQNIGPTVIEGRSVLSTIGHMFDTSLIAYGIIRMQYHYKKFSLLYVIKYFMFAAIAHGLYDFWLINHTLPYGMVFTLMFFLYCVSLYAQILNNALNNSTFFNYKHVVDSNYVSLRIMLYYTVLFAASKVFIGFHSGLHAVFNSIGSTLFSFFIVTICAIRLSRFKLIQGRWNKLKFELPFTLLNRDGGSETGWSTLLKIKGESFNEAYVNSYFEEYFQLSPLNKANSTIGGTRIAYIYHKVFLRNDSTFYLARIYKDSKVQQFDNVLLRPKTSGKTLMKEEYPIVAIMTYEEHHNLSDTSLGFRDFEFNEWAFIRPIEKDK